MDNLQDEILKAYGNKLRVRVCGFCLINDKILLVKHHNLGESGILWAPPGGGVNFGESLQDCLIREFKEETGLEVTVGKFLFINEFLDIPLHAIELFFEVVVKHGEFRLGSDPEFPSDKQLLHDIQLFSFDEIKNMNPKTLHGVLNKIKNIDELKSPVGFIK